MYTFLCAVRVGQNLFRSTNDVALFFQLFVHRLKKKNRLKTRQFIYYPFKSTDRKYKTLNAPDSYTNNNLIIYLDINLEPSFRTIFGLYDYNVYRGIIGTRSTWQLTWVLRIMARPTVKHVRCVLERWLTIYNIYDIVLTPNVYF